MTCTPNTTKAVEQFISKKALQQPVNTALKIAKEVFGASDTWLELDTSDGDVHVRLNVDSNLHGDALLDAYEQFYLQLMQQVPIEQRVYIGLSF